MQPPVVFLFSGQGSQYHQMGRKLFQQENVFRFWMRRGDAIVFERTGHSILKLLYDETASRGHPFDDIHLSHPAIFLVEFAMAQCLLAAGIRPDALIGSSVGIFAAWAVSGCLPFEPCLEAVIRQAEIVADTCPPGGMLAILGAPSLYREDPRLYRHSELAGVNFHRHFTVSGLPEELNQVASYLKSERIPFQRLPVRHAFHSHHVEPAAGPYRTFLNELPEPQAQIPIQATIFGETDCHTLWRAVREPTDFFTAIRSLESSSPRTYIDVGPSGTLATFLKYILRPDSASQAFPILTPFGNDAANLAHLLTQVGVSPQNNV